jgi:hypothetical protein
MGSVKVSIRLADGGLQEFTKGARFVRELRSLQSQGFVGKELIHRLLTDDWAAPPTVVVISWKSDDDTHVEERIPYI